MGEMQAHLGAQLVNFSASAVIIFLRACGGIALQGIHLKLIELD